jgi:hypothetical protein
MAPVIFGLLATLDAAGFDARADLLPLLALTPPATRLPPDAAETLGAYLQRFLQPTRDDVINSLYDELAELAAVLPSDPGLRPDYDERLAELRRFQEEEAAEVKAELLAARALDPRTLDDAIAVAEEMLRREDASRKSRPA